MDLTIFPRQLSGTIRAIPSKSQAHRLLICAAFSNKSTFLECPQTNEDIEATVSCLCALGANITREQDGYHIIPVTDIPNTAVLHCGESGSTLRFILPITCALGVNATFVLKGRLPYRPLSPLWEELERMGCTLTRPTENTIQSTGKLHAGNFSISGNVSSQFISGLLFATALMKGTSTITITGALESKPYVEMTQSALKIFGVDTDNFQTSGSCPFSTPGKFAVEGDWSNAAFFLTAAALGSTVEVTNLNPDSPQGDRAIADILTITETMPHISAADIPDLVPIMAVYFGAKHGAVFTNITRLRLKESDRVASVCKMMEQLGVQVISSENTMTVFSGKYHSCTIDAAGDHRIAMAGAIAASIADGPVTIKGAECVAKSYPSFWEEYQKLGGHYEQYLR